MPKRTALYDEHVKLGAKIVPFAGWEMPISYKGIIVEHESVRNSCGIFDVGHMGIVDIKGQDALPFILRVATNNAGLLSENEGQYTAICNENGGTLDDVFVFKLPDCYRFVINASNVDKILVWFSEKKSGFGNMQINHRNDLGILSLQGPKSKSLLGVSSLPARNHCQMWGDLLYSHTGYTGEEGFEFFVPIDSMENVWETFISLGIRPCGLGARDTLRLEAGLPLYGHEYDEQTSLLEVGYSWAAKFDHDFIGKAALEKQKSSGISRVLCGLIFSDKAIPRQGAKIFSNNKLIGVVTSGSFSPTKKIPIALGFVDPKLNVPGTTVEVEIRDKLYSAVVSKKKMV